MKALLDQCVNRGLYGDQSATIRHFVNIGLERLIEQGRIIDSPLMAAPEGSNDKTNQGGDEA